MSALSINPGLCSGCEVSIWYVDPITRKMVRPLSNYREFHFITNNERMNRHAICSSCINTLTDSTVVKIFERIRETWRQQMIGNASIEDFVKLDKQQVVCWDIDEKECQKKYYGKK